MAASPTKKILIGLGLAVVLLIALIAVFGRGGEEGVAVETAPVEIRSVTRTVTASGEISPEVDVSISPDVSGEIVFLGVEEGDPVRGGQLLVRIRSDLYASQQAQAQAGVRAASADAAQAQAELERAQQTLARQENLFERGVVARAELEAAQSAVRTARAAVQAAQSRAANARAGAQQAAEQVRQTAIYAPIGGTVSQLNVEQGERVVGTAQMAGTEILRIARLDAMEIQAEVNETDVVHITQGDSARVEVDAYPDRPLGGVVTQIANSARMENQGTAQAVTNFPVTVRITDDRREPTLTAGPAEEGAGETVRLRPGMSGTVDIFTRTVRNAVAVPIQAVTVRDFNEVAREERRAARARGEDVDSTAISDEEDLRRVVFVMTDEGTADMREVETGIADETHIVILSGLEGGEQVITGPFRMLRSVLMPGDAVHETEDAGETSE